MESDAFKIPLRPNPSTLPNVFPTILHARSQAFKTNTKAFLFYPFSRKHVLSDQCTSCPERRTRTTGSVDVDRPSDSPLLLTRLSREWIKGLAWAWTHVLLLSLCLTKAITLTLHWIWIILYSSSMRCTYAGMRCLEFYQQCGRSWGLWRPLASGSKQRNDHLLHMSDSTCIQNSDIDWDTHPVKAYNLS